MHGIVEHEQRTLGETVASFYSHVGSDTIDFWFRFSAESPSLLSVAHTVSAECDTSLSAYFRLRPKVEFPLSVDLYYTASHLTDTVKQNRTGKYTHKYKLESNTKYSKTNAGAAVTWW